MVLVFVPLTRAFGDEVFDPADDSRIRNLFTSHSSVPDVDQTTGAFVHRVPLDIPPGRNGLTPELGTSIQQPATDDGIVGYGWSLSLPYIERFNRTGIDRLYTDNYFTSSLGGELATTSTANEYRHRFEDGRFIAYTFSNNSWIAYDKKGTKYTFGASTTAQLSRQRRRAMSIAGCSKKFATATTTTSRTSTARQRDEPNLPEAHSLHRKRLDERHFPDRLRTRDAHRPDHVVQDRLPGPDD